MSWENEINEMLGYCVDDSAFGVSFVHRPAIGPIQTLNGIWSNEYETVEPSNGIAVMSATPVVDFRISDLTTYPARKDIFEKDGVQYIARAIEPDGQGAVSIALEKVI